MAQPMQRPPTLGQPPIPLIHPRLGTLQFSFTPPRWVRFVVECNVPIGTPKPDLVKRSSPVLALLETTTSAWGISDLRSRPLNGALDNPHLDTDIRALHLSVVEKHALVEFLRTLNGIVRDGF